MPAIKFSDDMVAHFVFNQIIIGFKIPKEIFTDYGRHFKNKMMTELAWK